MPDPHWGQPRTRSVDATLCVVTSVFNPLRFRARYDLYAQFAARLAPLPNVALFTVECALGARPFEVTRSDDPRHLQLRSSDTLWLKENLVNLGIARLPAWAEYVAWIDADVVFTHPHWADETLHALQHHPVVQLFSHAIDLGPRGEPLQTFGGFAYSHVLGIAPGPVGRGGYSARWHPGFAWAARREALDLLGGLLDFSILGSGDTLMAHSLIGQLAPLMYDDLTPTFGAWCRRWAKRAEGLRRDLGYVPGTLLHSWHGAKAQRKYWDRRQILIDYAFDPFVDLIPDAHGLWQLTTAKPGLRDAIRAYFAQRNEDDLSVSGGSAP